MVTRPEELNREELINAIWLNRGIVTRTADYLRVSDKTIYNYAAKYQTVQTAITESRAMFRGRLLDIGEMALERALAEGKAWAVRLVMDKLGPDRGYIEQTKLAVEGDLGGLVVNIGGGDGEE